MTSQDEAREPIALYAVELDGLAALVTVHGDGHVVLRHSTDGQVRARRRLPGEIKESACAVEDGAPTLFVTTGEGDLLAHDLGAAVTTTVADGLAKVTALTAGQAGGVFLVVAGSHDGTVTLYERRGRGRWESASARRHTSKVVSVALGTLGRVPVVLSCAADATVSAVAGTVVARSSVWTVNWSDDPAKPTGLSSVWSSGFSPDHAVLAVLDQSRFSSDTEPEIWRRRWELSERVRTCDMLDVEGASVVLVSGRHQSRPVIAIDDLPGAGPGTGRLAAVGAPAPLLAVHRVAGGANLAFADDSTIHVWQLRIRAGRPWIVLLGRLLFLCALWVLLLSTPSWLIAAAAVVATAWTVLRVLRAPAHWNDDLRRTTAGWSFRHVTSVDLHADITHAAFDRPDGLVVLTRRGMVALDLSSPEAEGVPAVAFTR